MSEVLVVGDAIVDIVFDGVDRLPDPGEEVVASQYEIRAGGSGGYASLGLAALGEETRVSTLVGTDEFSDRWIGFVEEWGVDTDGVERVADGRASTAAAFLTPDDRSFVTYRGAAGSDQPVVPDLDGCDAVLVAGFSQAPYLWSDAVVDFIRGLADRDVPVFLDTNWSPSPWREAFETVIPAIDYLMVNDEEARRLGDADTVAAAGRTLRERGVGTCVIKTGADGCTLVDDGGVAHVDTEPVEAVDTCGAGDLFNAGFISELLAGRSTPAAAATANRCAGEAVQVFELGAKLERIRALA
jgi:sugar/nucleoside kinase (ribokinase family)